MGKQQILIRVGDVLGDWLDSQAEELEMSKPQLIISLLKLEMVRDKGISNDINNDIKSDSGVSKEELEQKLDDIKADINKDINELDTAISVVNNNVGAVKTTVENIDKQVNDINDINIDIIKRLEVLERLVASKPKRGRPPKKIEPEEVVQSTNDI